jgi:hypothetical protein
MILHTGVDVDHPRGIPGAEQINPEIIPISFGETVLR